MTCDLFALCFEAKDPLRLARFWGGVLGWEMTDDRRDDGAALLPSDDTGFRIRFPASQDEKASQNRMHFDLTSTSLQDQQQTVARSLGLGARHIDIGQSPDEGHVVLADPEGNEFCIIEPGNNFLAGCGRLGSITCDGTREVGYFWSAALGWSLVWDQDEETAIQSPTGDGPKITWSGPPLLAKSRRARIHFHVAPAAGTSDEEAVADLLRRGATRLDHGGNRRAGAVALADVDGNQLCLVGSSTT